MDKKNFPSFQKGIKSLNEEKGQSIFQNTVIDPYITSQYQLHSNSNASDGRVFRNTHNMSKKSAETNPALISKKKSNNFIGEIEGAERESSPGIPLSENKMVPVGYFENQSVSNKISTKFNSTSRHQDNSMLNNVVLPKLNRTTKNETLYSIKSKKNSSPHARMMQSLKKKKKKSKPIPETVDSFKEKSKVKQSRFTKPKKEISIKE